LVRASTSAATARRATIPVADSMPATGRVTLRVSQLCVRSRAL
jgi:hypothetical protein